MAKKKTTVKRAAKPAAAPPKQPTKPGPSDPEMFADPFPGSVKDPVTGFYHLPD